MKKIIIILIPLIVLGLLIRPPVDGGKLTSWWGIRPGGLDGWFHSGSDIGHATGTPINPVSSGTVKQTGFDDIRGYYVNISHLGFMESRYYHLDKVDVTESESVNHRSVIGTVGNTGLSTGPHLHYEIRFFGVPFPAFLFTLPGRVVKSIVK